ncbi:hypothetical protein CON67_31300, partial [Bacillus toyonensis]
MTEEEGNLVHFLLYYCNIKGKAKTKRILMKEIDKYMTTSEAAFFGGFLVRQLTWNYSPLNVLTDFLKWE